LVLVRYVPDWSTVKIEILQPDQACQMGYVAYFRAT
jgi:hypothetical protein